MSSQVATSAETESLRDIVGEEKSSVLNSGAVKDSSSQSLSTLAERASALGDREGVAMAKPRGPRTKAKPSAGTNCPSRRTPCVDRESEEEAAIASEGSHTEHPLKRSQYVRSAIASHAVHQLDDSPEFEGVSDAYDKGRTAKRVLRSIRSAKSKDASAVASAKKAKGATAVAKGSPGASHALGTQAAAKGAQAVSKAAAVAKEAGATKALAATASSAGAPIAGVIAGILAFVLGVLVVSQIVSSLFGFWENEANKEAMEGLPPYITYEMVEAALECQETYGHPAGCTLAQIIAESGQGDHMSQLATRDHNLFGIKWASSFAACPEVTGKSSWRTGEVYDGASVVITAYFTVFKSDVDCIRFRSRVFLKQSHFANNASIKEGIANRDSDKMAEGLKEGGWATSPVYVESLKSIMDTYGLRRFDSMSASDWKDMDAKAQKILAAAESQLGVKYVWGGSTPGVGLDCSGLTQYCYAQAGITIGHNTEVQAGQLRHVPLSQAKPGDILYRHGHVAIYAGGDQYIHEPHSGDVCKRSTGINSFSYALTYRAV